MGNSPSQNVKRIELEKIKKYKFISKKVCQAKINSLVILNDGRIAAGDYKGFIYVFDSDIFHRDMTIDTKINLYKIMVLYDNKILVYSSNSIKIYSIFLLTYTCIFVKDFNKHLAINIVISLSNERFALTSISHKYEKEIQIWKCKNTFTRIKTLIGSKYNVLNLFYVQKKEKLIAFSVYIYIWNLQNYQSETIIAFYVSVYPDSGIAELNNNTVIVGAINKIVLIDLSSYVIKTLDLKEIKCNFSSFLQINDDVILCGGLSFLVALNIETESFIKIKIPHSFYIDNLYMFKEQTFIFGSDNIFFFGEKDNKYLNEIEKNFNIYTCLAE